MIPGSMHKVVPARSFGGAKIVHDSPDALERLRAARDGQPLVAEKYTRLIADGRLWMTDAEYECWTNYHIVDAMYGDVLVVGLGIGLVLHHLPKAVKSATVLEINPDIIGLVGGLYPKAKIIQGDCMTWDVPRQSFDCIYLDIWPSVPGVDQWDEIKSLKRKYRRGLKAGGWVKAWCEDHARSAFRKERRQQRLAASFPAGSLARRLAIAGLL